MASGQEVAKLYVSIGADIEPLLAGMQAARAETLAFGAGLAGSTAELEALAVSAGGAGAQVREAGLAMGLAEGEAAGGAERLAAAGAAVDAQLEQEAGWLARVRGELVAYDEAQAVAGRMGGLPAGLAGVRAGAVETAESMAGFGRGLQGALGLATEVGIGLFAVTEGFHMLKEGLGVERLEQFGEQVIKLRSIMGGSAEEASTLLATFERFGVSADQSGVMLGIFSRHLQGVQDPMEGVGTGGKSSAEALRELGVSATDATGTLRPTSDIILDVAEGFSRMPDGAEKSAIAMSLFGRSGREIIFALDQGREGMQLSMETAKRLGMQLSGENVEAVHAYAMANRDLDQAFGGLQLQIGTHVLPALTAIALSLTRGITATEGAVGFVKEHTSALTQNAIGLSALAAIGGPAALALLGFGHAVEFGADRLGLFHSAEGLAAEGSGGLRDAMRETGAEFDSAADHVVTWSDIAKDAQKAAIDQGRELAATIGEADDAFLRHPGLDSYGASLLLIARSAAYARGQELAAAYAAAGETDLFSRHPDLDMGLLLGGDLRGLQALEDELKAVAKAAAEASKGHGTTTHRAHGAAATGDGATGDAGGAESAGALAVLVDQGQQALGYLSQLDEYAYIADQLLSRGAEAGGMSVGVLNINVEQAADAGDLVALRDAITRRRGAMPALAPA